MKQLLVGDFHAVPEELDECERVGDLIVETVERERPRHVVFLGDQYNNHASVHVRVQDFWLRLFQRLTKGLDHAQQYHDGPVIIAIKGNHDLDPTHEVQAHALQAHRHQVYVVEKPLVIDGILFVPYTHDPEQFYAWVNGDEKPKLYEPAPRDANILICHQTFNGCTYENGFYAKDGYDLARVPQPGVISGHIHKPQVFGKLWYPGAPRWRSASDANTRRAIYLIEHHEGRHDPTTQAGFAKSVKHIDTAPYCRVLYHFEVTPEVPFQAKPERKDLWVVDVRGPEAFVREQQALLKAAGCRVRAHPTSTAAISIRESEGIGKSFHKHLDGFTPKFGTEKAVLARMAQERLGI